MGKKFMWLRRLHGSVHEWRLKKQKQVACLKYVLFPLGKKIYVIGTPEHTNVGDSAIALAELMFLKKCGYSKKQIKEITFNEYNNARKVISRFIRTSQIICWHGGGNLGDQWINEEYFRRNAMRDFKNNSMIIFPQTIFYSNTEFGQREMKESIKCYNGYTNLTMVAREKKSFEIMSDLYSNTDIVLTPDIVLSTTCEMYDVKTQSRTDVLVCFRNDIEKQLSSEECTKIQMILEEVVGAIKKTDMYSDVPITKQNRRECVRMKMEEFVNAKLVVTDRLHGMIFAAITGTPCIVFSNYNKKIEGTYEWIQELPYIHYAKSIDEFKNVLVNLDFTMENVFDNSGWIDNFKKLENIIKSIT